MKYIAIILVLFIGGCVTKCSSSGLGYGYSDGERHGTIVKLSRKGLVWKSWEGEMAMGIMSQTTTTDGKGGSRTSVTNAWSFSARDAAIVNQLHEAMTTGRPVTLVYRQYFVSPVTIDTSTVIVEVKP